jgi:hypothetical protein
LRIGEKKAGSPVMPFRAEIKSDNLHHLSKHWMDWPRKLYSAAGFIVVILMAQKELTSRGDNLPVSGGSTESPKAFEAQRPPQYYFVEIAMILPAEWYGIT